MRVVDSKTSTVGCFCSAENSIWVAKWVWYSRNEFKIPYSGAHTLRSRCNICKKWLMAGGGGACGARGWRAAWLVASAFWLHCTLRCAGLASRTGWGSTARGGFGGTSGKDGLG